MRIVSLLPSATEIVCDLGLGASLVGVSHECDHPPFVATLPKVTSSVIPKDAPSADIDTLVRGYLADHQALYALDLDLLERLRPDLIVTQALCDVCAVSAEDVEAAVCALPGGPAIVNLEPMCLADVFATIRAVGAAAGCGADAARRVEALELRIRAVARRRRLSARPRVLLLEWIDPPFNAGHWNSELIELAGGIDCLGNAGAPSRRLGWDEIAAAAPELLVVACCGYTVERTLRDLPLLEQRPEWRALPCAATGRVHVLDGNAYFSRPGPRLVDGLELLADTFDASFNGIGRSSSKMNAG
jgi:iron complex transport system substrate-binding protein